MERAGNEELTEDTEKKGLGTPATRAAIIEKLIQSGFVNLGIHLLSLYSGQCDSMPFPTLRSSSEI